MRAGVIYVATNIHTGDQYVGLTIKTTEERRKQHLRNARRGLRTYFYSAIRKYGEEAFIFEDYVSVFDRMDLSGLEQQIIKELQARYNQTNGGEVTFGRKYNDEVKERIRQGSLGKKRTPEQNAVNRQLAKARWDNDPVFREQCLAGAAKGRANIDQAKRIEAVRAAQLGKKWSDEARAKLSASCMGRRYGPDVIERMAVTKRKAVKCNETGEIFSCREEAAEKTGISCRTIFRDVRGENRKPAKGRPTFSYI